MYIAYVTPQRVADPNYTKYASKGGDFRPTWLIRTSDWQKVPGHQATDGYHTLSYCWEQSGEKFRKADGEFGLVDNGYHEIVRGKDGSVNSCYTTYDELLQQICKDFDIEYLWYDKICIDQTNKAEKHREIKRMHLIYSNARYTVALVPEVNIEDPRDFDCVNWVLGVTEAKHKALEQMFNSLWWKRSWTLEEVMMSTRILIVGRNTHFWSLANFKQGKKRKENDQLANTMLGFTKREIKSANQVLYHAHFRTSTKAHDRIYALANIFHGIIDINVDYDSDVSTVVKEFYQCLAKKDLSIMCFGSNLDPEGQLQNAPTMDCYSLPSWTGVSGLHSPHAIPDVSLDRNSDYTVDDNMQLHIKCRSYTIRPTKYSDYDVYLSGERKKKAFENHFKVITSMNDFGSNESEALDWSLWCMFRTTGCTSTHYHKPDDHTPLLSPILPLSLTEECGECVILGVVFDSLSGVTVDYVPVGYNHDYLSPVARKSADGSSYIIIGVVLLGHYQCYEFRPTPQEVMDWMFSNLGCETQKFCIE